MTWTSEQIDAIIDGVSKGLSAGCIAREIGTTRNAVISKGRRIGVVRWHSRIKLPSLITPEIRSKSWEAHRRNRAQKAAGRKAQPRELTKGELRELLAQAVRYTASLQVPTA